VVQAGYLGAGVKALNRAISTDGRRIFFNSDDALLPQDVNEQTDVYEWTEGQLYLISSGQSSSGSFLQTISPSGRDVLIGTREQLAASDVDQVRDLYDVRVEGGFASPGGPYPCEGESCRGAASAPSSAPTAGSATFAGPPNPQVKRKKPKPRKQRGKHAKKKQQGKKKQQKKEHRKTHGTKRHG
jgi:hypothetical protein